MTAWAKYLPGFSSASGVGKASASAPTVSGSPGFQSFTSLAKAGSGLNQLSPRGNRVGSDLVSSTKTRPVNGRSRAAWSNVRRNSTGFGSAARAGPHRAMRTTGR